MSPALAAAAMLLGLGSATPARGQQVANQPAAAQPSKGVTLARQQVRWYHLDDERAASARSIDQVNIETIIAHGLTADLTVMLHLPQVYRDIDSSVVPDDSDYGVRDFMLMGQYRFWQRDTAAIDTTRAAVLGGVEVPTFDDGFSSDSFDPFFGVALTHIRGRHGYNASTRFKFNTGSRSDPILGGDDSDNALFYDASYLYRLSPARYTAETHGATYFTLELNGLYEMNGDHDLSLSPGVMYEAPWWVFEFSVQLPVLTDVDERPTPEWGVTAGLRILF